MSPYRIRVARFGPPEVLTTAPLPDRPPPGLVRVRVEHASLGATDLLARRGSYLLQPRTGFTPGYDLVGVVEHSTPRAAAAGLTVGARVVACLPRMGAHATHVDLPPRLLVRLPAGVDPARAAASTLDLLTAQVALRLAGLAPAGRADMDDPAPEGHGAPADAAGRRTGGPRSGGRGPDRHLLVQGASGAVGAVLTRLAVDAGLRVTGTSSPAGRSAVEAAGAAWVDYRDPAGLRAIAPVDAVVDHTGARTLRALVRPGGRAVRLSFVGRPGHERADTFRGSVAAVSRTLGRPAERVVSVPAFVAARPAAYRTMRPGCCGARPRGGCRWRWHGCDRWRRPSTRTGRPKPTGPVRPRRC